MRTESFLEKGKASPHKSPHRVKIDGGDVKHTQEAKERRLNLSISIWSRIPLVARKK